EVRVDEEREPAYGTDSRHHHERLTHEQCPAERDHHRSVEPGDSARSEDWDLAGPAAQPSPGQAVEGLVQCYPSTNLNPRMVIAWQSVANGSGNVLPSAGCGQASAVSPGLPPSASAIASACARSSPETTSGKTRGSV